MLPATWKPKQGWRKVRVNGAKPSIRSKLWNKGENCGFGTGQASWWDFYGLADHRTSNTFRTGACRCISTTATKHRHFAKRCAQCGQCAGKGRGTRHFKLPKNGQARFVGFVLLVCLWRPRSFDGVNPKTGFRIRLLVSYTGIMQTTPHRP